MSDDTYSNLIAQLARFSTQDLIELRDIINSESRRKHLARLLDNLSGLRKRDLNSGDTVSTEQDHSLFSKSDIIEQPTELDLSDEKEVLYKIFQDRQVFPGTKEIVLSINRALGFHYKPGDYNRKGRTFFLDVVWQRMQQIPDRKRRIMLKSLMSEAIPTAMKNDVGYQSLFNILARDERRT